MNTKIKLEDTCLTIEQAKELKDLGINFDETIYSFTNIKDEETDNVLLHLSENAQDIKKYCDKVKQDLVIIVPTLTNTEMLEMLPETIEDIPIMSCLQFQEGGNYKYMYKNFTNTNKIDCEKHLLRDSLFETLKELKLKNLI
jgi:hypothetical protein